MKVAGAKGARRRTSLQMFQDMLGLGGSRMEGDGMTKKNSLSKWSNFKSVDWQDDMRKDYEDHSSRVLEDDEAGTCDKLWLEGITWFIPAIVGVLTATSGWFIEKTVEWLGGIRFGYCPTSFLYTGKEECGGAWVDYSTMGGGYPWYILVSTVLATISATLTWGFAPMARGSGIPEIKTILGGMVFPEVLATNTLVVKIIGLSLSVGAGLSCGKEGPLVHIACCWSTFVAKLVPRFAKNEAKQRELLSCACAAGVAVAFGAPLGGVLFSLEEASTLFPNRTMIRAFFASSVAAVTLAWWNPTNSKGGKLTMFEASYNTPPYFGEYIWFVFLGALGGCIGAVFIHYNIMISKARAPGTWFRSKCHIILEVLVIAMVTAMTSYHLIYTQVLSNVTIRALFHACNDPVVDKHTFMLDMCDGDNPIISNELIGLLLLGAFLRFVQMTFTFGTGAPAGLFIPSLYTGAAIGRCLGILVQRLDNSYHLFGHMDHGDWVSQVSPVGIYAMMGAAAVLGGVCRVTISLVVIMFELTSGLQLIVPFMIVCLMAKWVGDFWNPGIYDYCITIRKYPFLHEPDEVTFSTNAGHIMDKEIVCLHPMPGQDGHVMQVRDFIGFLKKGEYGGYPLTQSPSDRTLLGYVVAGPLLQYLEDAIEEEELKPTAPCAFIEFIESDREKPLELEDLSKFVNKAIVRCVPDSPATQIHYMFRNLGLKIILVVDKAALVGMITKKSFINKMEELHSGHKHHPMNAQKTSAALGGGKTKLSSPLLSS